MTPSSVSHNQAPAAPQGRQPTSGIPGEAIPLPSLLFLIFGFASAKLLTSGFLPFIDTGGGTLVPYLITFVGFLASLRGGMNSSAARRRFIILSVATLMIVGMTTWRQSLVRMNNLMSIHDGAVQTEVAANFLLHGQNPYTVDYRQTLFGRALSPYRPDAVNLAWTHYAYPPAVVVSAVPSILLRPWLGPLTDIRWLYVMALVAITAAVVMVMRSWERRSVAVVLLLANPFIWLYAVAGFNDALAIAGLVIAAICLQRRHWASAGIMMGLALAAKQTAWLALPLWLWWIWRVYRSEKGNRPLRRSLLGLVLTTTVFYLPFLLWGPAALYDDLVRYVSGSIPFSYPISGSTFLQFLRIFGLVDSPWATISTWPYQLAAAGISWWIGWRWIRRRPTAATWIGASLVVTLSVAMVSRFFNDNYLSAMVLLGSVGVLLEHEYGREIS